jgi:hypothetical protein
VAADVTAQHIVDCLNAFWCKISVYGVMIEADCAAWSPTLFGNRTPSLAQRQRLIRCKHPTSALVQESEDPLISGTQTFNVNHWGRPGEVVPPVRTNQAGVM